MILSAQHVRSPGGQYAINCLQFAQAPTLLVANPLQRLNLPGKLIWQHRPLPQPGNRIVSFVDVSAPEDATVDEISAAINEFLALNQLPQAYAAWGSRVGFSTMTPASLTAAQRREEVRSLLHYFFQVHP